jgi:hypothetical protein
MQEKSKVVSRRWRTAAVLAAGVAVGAVLFATPAAGHFQASIDHIWSHIKPKADKRYVNEGCKSTRVLSQGFCIEKTNRTATNIYAASETCAAAGGFLPPNLMLRAAALASTAITLDALGEWSSTEFYDDTNQWQGFVVFEDGFNQATSDIADHKYRCAFGLGKGVGAAPAARSVVPRPAVSGRGGGTS